MDLRTIMILFISSRLSCYFPKVLCSQICMWKRAKSNYSYIVALRLVDYRTEILERIHRMIMLRRTFLFFFTGISFYIEKKNIHTHTENIAYRFRIIIKMLEIFRTVFFNRIIELFSIIFYFIQFFFRYISILLSETIRTTRRIRCVRSK